MSEAPSTPSPQAPPQQAAAPSSPAGETPQGADRLAEGLAAKPVLTPSQAKRANQTLKGMIISVVLTLLVALPVIAMNPANREGTYKRDINVSEVAAQAAQAADFTPVAPVMPEGWYANFARWTSAGADGVAFWEVGFVTTREGFIWMRQTSDANPSWIAQQTDFAPVTGVRTVDGTDWELRDKSGNRTLLLERNGATVMLTGESSFEDLDEAARAVMKALPADAGK
ncbi:hypothetical protein GCM10023081_44800 [Arthrobacter ginkgonis]|uniref:DUF4245 domain-containing protein n=1 Tax=Arthrobacter ginkgonis TaxID=1630594 RepID=A0ABP7DEU3_9MICC